MFVCPRECACVRATCNNAWRWRPARAHSLAVGFRLSLSFLTVLRSRSFSRSHTLCVSLERKLLQIYRIFFCCARCTFSQHTYPAWMRQRRNHSPRPTDLMGGRRCPRAWAQCGLMGSTRVRSLALANAARWRSCWKFVGQFFHVRGGQI